VSRHGRVYRRLLRFYPATFRRTYADEMARLFEDQVRDARNVGGSAAVVWLWARTATDLAATAVVARLRDAQRVRQPAGPMAPDHRPVPVPPARARVVVALTPIWMLLALLVLRPGFFDPIFDNPPGIAGMPAGALIMAVGLVWGLIGARLMRSRRSDAGALLTLLAFATPATFAVILGPALILIVQNLG